MYSDVDGLFYLLLINGSIVSLDLNGSSPVARKILHSVPGALHARIKLSTWFRHRPVAFCKCGG